VQYWHFEPGMLAIVGHGVEEELVAVDWAGRTVGRYAPDPELGGEGLEHHQSVLLEAVRADQGLALLSVHESTFRDEGGDHPVDFREQSQSVDLWSFGPSGSRTSRLLVAPDGIPPGAAQVARTVPAVAFVRDGRLWLAGPEGTVREIETEHTVLPRAHVDPAETMGRTAVCGSVHLQGSDWPDPGSGETASE
jgi:hypothetical protein